MMDSKPKSTGYESNYHDRQFSSPYESTISFCDWLVELGAFNGSTKNICDMGCGKGANICYMAKRFPHCNFYGMDIDDHLIQEGRNFLAETAISNGQLFVGDLHKAADFFKYGQFDGVVSFQTLSWLPSYEKALDAICSLAPKWIALTSLFYDGPIEAKTIVSEFDVSLGSAGLKRSLFYNTYSLPMVKRYLNDRGYSNFSYRPFEILIDLPRNSDRKMGTYTEKTLDGRRLQLSGPLMMNWYFIYAAIE